MLVGENGSGKTTLSWILSGLIVPTEGKITWSNYGLTNQGGAAKDGILIEASKTTKLNSDTEDFSKIGVAKLDFKRKIENKKNSRNNVVNSDNVTSAIVFQHSVFQLTERDVKGSVKPIIILDNMSADDLVGACLAAVGFSDSKMLNRSIYELSGGEIKRVAIASVLALMPKLIIFDEPLAGLDFSSKFKVRAIIESLSEMGIATIVVSHDYDEILPVCKRVIQLGDGQIVYDGSSEVWAQSKAGLI
jgi:energy-coupling factor transport system ATP-binding protein